MRSIRLLGIATLGVACGRDVRLGADLDAAIDTPGAANLFAPGSYTMRVLDPSIVFCDGSVAGMEPTFMSITRADLALVDGPVTLTVPTDTRITISGAPISTGWGQSQLDLVPNIDAPAGIWDAFVTGQFGGGPLGTSRIAMDLAADSATGRKPSGIEGQAAVHYLTLDASGTCDVAFAALFTLL